MNPTRYDFQDVLLGAMLAVLIFIAAAVVMDVAREVDGTKDTPRRVAQRDSVVTLPAVVVTALRMPDHLTATPSPLTPTR